MNIAVDARFYGSGHTGLGRYTTNVLKYLPKHLPDCTLQVLLKDSEYDNFPVSKNVVKIHAEIPHYSFSEQFAIPMLLKKIKSDLLYTLHFNTPIFSATPQVVTVHDLIKSHFTGSDTTTRSPWLYSLKRFGYNQVISHALTKSLDIIVPTNTVKNDILSHYPMVNPGIIHPIAEAPDEIFRNFANKSSGISRVKSRDLALPKNYLLFVGNAYPHKNLHVLLDALRELPEYDLVIVAKSSPFLSRALAPHDQTRIHHFTDLNDMELIHIYSSAKMLVTPSFIEGYGLVGLESLMIGTPVVASNIPVYREVYGNLVTYFDPTSVKDLVRAIRVSKQGVDSPKLRFDRTWDDVAKSIAEVIHARCTSL